MIDTLLVANRGEIACRVMRTAKAMGIRSVAVHSAIDASARHVREADVAVNLGGAKPAESYLLIDRIIAAAKASGAQAIHPGYGFLSENAGFARAIEEAGLIFLGPPASAIEAMGSKSAAKSLMEAAGVPLVPGYHGEKQDLETFREAAARIGYPVLLKAAAGGGGKGMKVAESEAQLAETLESAQREAQSAFIGYVGAGTVEFLLDERGDFFFMEMNTRLQVEHPVTEAITGLDLVAWQIRVARGEPLPITQQQVPLNGHAIEVRLYAEDPDHDFLPATGTLGLYREAAAGQGRRTDSGVAEDDSVSPFYDPMLGKLIAWGENREEARLRLLAMLDETLVGGVKTNLAFLRRILAHPAFAAGELDTGFIPRHQQQLLPAPSKLPEAFWQVAADAWVQSETPWQRADDTHSPWAARSGWRAGGAAEIELHLNCQGESRKVRASNQAHLQGEHLLADIDGTRQRLHAIRRGETLYLHWHGELHAITRFDPIAAAEASHAQQGGLSAPMNGSIVRVLVEPGQAVEAGTALVVLEAMKMEHSIRAPEAGTVKALYCREGEMVSEGAVLVELEP